MSGLDHAKRPCPACSSAGPTHHLHEQRFLLPEGHPLPERYDVVCCSVCGFVFADTLVDQKKYDAFYAECSKYEDSSTGTGAGFTPFDRKRLRETADEIAKWLSPEARVLDIGCANGGLLAALREQRYKRLSGADPSAACARNTRALGFECRQACLADLAAAGGAFDAVILSHVLEHIYDLSSAVGVVSKILAPGGRIYAEVPDATRYADFIFAPFQDFNTEHINHFSPMTLDRLLCRFGFRRLGSGAKVIAINSDTATPALFGIFELSERAAEAAAKDEMLRVQIGSYIEGSRRLMKEIDLRIREGIGEDQPAVVWGTGQLTMKLLCESSLANHPITAFVDGNPINQGRTLRGVRILAPREMAASGIHHPIVIGSLLHGREIADGIRALGIRNRLIDLRG